MHPAPHQRSVVHARHGMVAAAHPLAVNIGLDILKKGGTAVDAAIGVNAALGVLEPMMCGIGGDLFAMVWDAGAGKLHGINASGSCPSGMSIDAVAPAPDGTIPLRSQHAWTIPGCVDGWRQLHQEFGRMSMAEILAPAVRCAREGEPVPRIIAATWAELARELKDMPGFADIYLTGGRAPREGEEYRNEALARTYERIGADGRDFYSGAIAGAIEAYSKSQGGFLSAEDLASYQAEWIEPIWAEYRGVRVYEMPPNGQGLAALQMLNILENFDLRSLGRNSPELWHLMVEAKKLAFEDAASYYADPSFAEVPIHGLLCGMYASERAALIDRDRAALQVPAGNPMQTQGDTTYFAVADAEGNMVSLIQSLFWGFGSGHAVEGFALQNRGALFNLDPSHPNCLQAGKRPFNTIIPGFASRDGQPWLAFGVMGGSMQPQGHAQVLINILDFDMDLQEAGDAVRFNHLDSSQPTGTSMTDGGLLLLELGAPESLRKALAQKGHRIQVGGGQFGGYQAVARDPASGVYSGATESRKDGCAMGY